MSSCDIRNPNCGECKYPGINAPKIPDRKKRYDQEKEKKNELKPTRGIKKEDLKRQFPIVWVLGGPGSGKGTQCDLIVKKYGFTHLSTGDLLRDEVASGSEKGKKLKETMEKGELVTNETVLDLLQAAMDKAAATTKGYLIDGYPREKEQGVMFEKQIGAVDLILYFDVVEDTLVKRLLGRAQSSGRADDNETTIKLRIKTFKENNDKVISQYPDRLKTINAEGEVDSIFKEVQAALDPLVQKYAA